MSTLSNAAHGRGGFAILRVLRRPNHEVAGVLLLTNRGYDWGQTWPDDGGLRHRAAEGDAEHGHPFQRSPAFVGGTLHLQAFWPVISGLGLTDESWDDWDLFELERDSLIESRSRAMHFSMSLVATLAERRTQLTALSWPSGSVTVQVVDPDPRFGEAIRQRYLAQNAAKEESRHRPLPRAQAAEPARDLDEPPKPPSPVPADDVRIDPLDLAAQLVRSGDGYQRSQRADLLLAALSELVDESGALYGDLLDSAVRSMRANVNPFSGVMEAPKAWTAVHQKYGERLLDLEGDRDSLLADVITDVVVRYLEISSIRWSDLVRRGVSRAEPPPPDMDDW